MEMRKGALGKERDGKGYYLRCGAEAGVPELSRIFEMFSEDETRHADALHALQTGGEVKFSHSRTLEGAKPILRRLAIVEKTLSCFNGDLRVFGSAMDFEAANVRHFAKLAAETEDAGQRDLYLKIAAEDEIHFTLLEYMYDLLRQSDAGGASNSGVNDGNC
jgi:rubrerythrin